MSITFFGLVCNAKIQGGFFDAKKNQDTDRNQFRKRYTKHNLVCGSVYGLPQFLFEPEFNALTNDARILYALLYDAQKMSLKNKWYDDNGEVYVLCKREAMQQMLRLSDKTVKKTVDVLKEHAILEEVRQGWTMLNKIYLLYPTDKIGMPINPSNRRIYDSEPENLRFTNRKGSDSKPGENTIQDTEELRFKSQNVYVPNPENLRFKPRKNSDSETGKITIQSEKSTDSITGNSTIQDTEKSRFKPRKVSDSGAGGNTVHDTQILRDKDSISKNRENAQNSMSNIVQISLKDRTIMSIDVSEVIVIRIWEDGHKKGTTLITKDINYELKPLTHYECTGLFGVTDFFICNNEVVVNKNYVSKVNYEECTLTLKNGIQLDFKIHKTKTIRQYCKGV